ncbi:TetR/AcrR family transcriptional regulator [Kibdelosporangium philippinense]|uniref:TetR/AcrR family transcriptional regulator n=1 Tax=Kibdelosporangium philippinense TaxID=211113 RepID=A0ABS8Z8S8_9PSEU|nr:TetR/AcrR family transcriptional regulator [Kibdelosporangium philippinense]MCE7004281.1 TetR/AcrR family transcriptional regulator [Kibdelosporangium philippinense]
MTETPRDRLLHTAARLFYTEGIRAVGMDRLVAEASVTRATCYRHFAGKDDLVLAYLDLVDGQIRDEIGAIIAKRPPAEALIEIFEYFGAYTNSAGFRGCNFLNAAAEHPDRDSPARKLIATHRAWLRETFRELLEKSGHPKPDEVVGTLVLLRDGAMSGGELDDPKAVRAALRNAVKAIVG